MLEGGKVGLRARHDEDIPILRAELYDDVVDSSRAEEVLLGLLARHWKLDSKA